MGFRQDDFGNILAFDQFGKRSEYGWEIDHIHPVALGGSDAPGNLRALHWRSNRSLGGLLGNEMKAGNALAQAIRARNALK
ncbi:HNH endonuclease [Caulobacter segnis]|uniref:HNH endonuclease n=2 Tax=Caulobacter segnis TaxID=88688 RepID=A0ABN5IYQ6_9CAUL|nr:HNH endonuclease [Caulobacter segnis]